MTVETIDISCRHRGKIIETVESDLRTGKPANIYDCTQYGRCTVYTEIAEIQARCFSCRHRNAMQPCIHRGDENGRIECPSCSGTVKVKTFDCAIHKKCTLGKRIEDVACCVGCPDLTPITFSASDPASSLPAASRCG